ncbi:Leucine-rich repeat (LRR) family protein [Citrus sinensis]|uniref:Leucine-rich repeat (LRR) family protein n=1 Tax=Citrus sinensis TaxID=2711 RepID=A0ACB8LWZ9_CITSI|nr:Leucine-rich repeat (LRR) family protein [Citrus sinensis]
MSRWRSTGIVALRDAKLKTFPDDVLNLDKSVRTLDLTHNKIVDIPMEISKLINIQRLVLDDNHIERLPVNLGKLQSLKVMTLDGNRITSLPDELGQLVRLERLSILGNMLTCLPETIGSLRNIPANLLKDCKALQNISLHNNPISMDQFQQMEGFEEFEARRRKKFDKQIDSNVMISSKGLNEGVDK